MKIKQVFLLNRRGDIMGVIGHQANRIDSAVTLPVVIDYYDWDLNKQASSADKYKDQIKRVFYQDKVEKQTKVMLQDDVRRLELIRSFNYGSRILEAGASDGSVSIKIASQPKVKNIIAIDIRQSAITDGKKLIKDLIERGDLSKGIANKISLKKMAVEKLPLRYGEFNSVCAYEIFEHLPPWDFMPVFMHLYKFIKPNGKFFISVPNRFLNEKYEKEGRSRWRWFDHRNFFSRLSLELMLRNFFKEIKFYSLYPNERVEEGIYLICECNRKKHAS